MPVVVHQKISTFKVLATLEKRNFVCAAPALSRKLQIYVIFPVNEPVSVWFLIKKRKNLAWIMLLWNHYMLWSLKKFPQHGDIF